MKQSLLVTLLTVLGFAAGFVARVWTERGDRPLPPPPTIGSEFLPGSTVEKKPAPRPAFNRAQLVAEIEKLRPQIDAYRERFEALDTDYEKAFREILNPEQRRAYDVKEADHEKRRAEREAKAAGAPPPPPLSDEEIAKLRQRPFERAFWKLSYIGRLEQTVKDHNLDAKQEAAVRRLLIERREKFLALVDSTPSPTFKLTALAASVQRLVDPNAAEAAAPATAPAK